MLAKITKVEERVVKVEDDDEDNPFDLSNGLRWFMVDAVKEQSRASPLQVSQGTVNVNPATYNLNKGQLAVYLAILFQRAHEIVQIQRPRLSLGLSLPLATSYESWTVREHHAWRNVSSERS